MPLEHYGQAKVFKVVKVEDGDTFTAIIAEWPAIIGHNIRIRIFGVNTPERNSPDPDQRRKAEAATGFLKGLLSSARQISLERIKRDKYFRLLAVVRVDGHCVGGAIYGAGFSDSYSNEGTPL